MNSEHRYYWTAWLLEKAHVRVRLTSGAREWIFSPREIADRRWMLDDEVWDALEKAVADDVRERTLDIALDPEPDPRRDEELDLPLEWRRALGAMGVDLHRRLSRFLSEHDGWDEPPSEAPDARAWGHEIAATFTASLRALLGDPRGPALIREKVLYVRRWDDVGTPMPEVLHDAGKEGILEGIQEALAKLDTRECDAFLERFAHHPLLLSDWAIARWQDAAQRDALRSWLSFLADLSLRSTVWCAVGRDPQSMALHAQTDARCLELARKHRDVVAAALDGAELRNELEGEIIHGRAEDYEDDSARWQKAPRESFASIALRKIFDALARPELDAPGLRAVDRVVLLETLPGSTPDDAAAWLSLVRSSFWQSLAPDDVARWCELKGFAILFHRPTEAAWRYLSGRSVVDFWLRVASSDRSPAAKTELFEVAVDIAQTHDCVEFDEMNDLMARLAREATPELAASGAD